MANPFDATTAKPPRIRQRVPRSLQIFLTMLAFLVVCTSGWISFRIYPRWTAIREIERLGGSVETTRGGPEWLRGWIERDQMRALEDVVEVHVAHRTSDTDDGLACIARFPRLRKLHLTSAADSVLRKLEEQASVVELELSGESLTDAGLSNLKHFPNVETLILGPGVTDEGLSHLKVLTNLRTLRMLNNMTDAGLTDIGALSQLESLNLDGTRISDRGLEHLRGLTNLNSLDLGHTEITGGGLIHLRPLMKLRFLSLSHTQITDTALEYVQELGNLEELHISLSRVSDAGLKHLTGLQKLKVLGLQYTYVTEGGIAKLKLALPGVNVLLTPAGGSGSSG